jgi:hypothetical protein
MEDHMTTYHLRSSGFVHTPGMLAWAINGYHFPDDRKYLRSVFVKGWNLPNKVADALLSGKLPYTVNDENGTVSFEVAS